MERRDIVELVCLRIASTTNSVYRNAIPSNITLALTSNPSTIQFRISWATLANNQYVSIHKTC